MLNRIKIDIERGMGWLTLAGGGLILLFWTVYFAGAMDLGQHDPVLAGFESAFPIADALFCILLIAAGVALLRRRPAGPYFLVAAGAVSVYLGLLDVTFYGARGAYSPLTAEGLFQLFLSAVCLGAGGLAFWASWRLWPGSRPASARTPASNAGRVIIVTGSANGIGAATAERLAREGAVLVLADINEPALENQRRRLAAAGHRITAIATDVSDPDAVDELIEGALLAFGRVDALVNCAGVLVPGATDAVSQAALRRQVETNLLGTIHTTRAVLPHFRRHRAGHLVHVASLGGIVPLPGEATYAATKFAIRGFCQSLSLELRETPIRVSVVSPDSTDTAQYRRETLGRGSSLSFTSAALSADEVARAISRVLLKPRREVTVPALRGRLAMIAGFAPGLLAAAYPWLDRQGRRRREQLRAALQSSRLANAEAS
jgi:short-subunit dehydrogenase